MNEAMIEERNRTNTGTAVLGNLDIFTTFSYDGKTLTFRTCKGLERYTRVLKWDHGYLEVMAKYIHQPQEIEEYIDLEPILDRLYMNKEEFLAPIQKVRDIANRAGTKENYLDMYKTWKDFGGEDFYHE